MNFRIVLKCTKGNDAAKFDRDLQMNSYEAADATFKTLARGVLEDIIDPFTLEFYYEDDLRYRLEKI